MCIIYIYLLQSFRVDNKHGKYNANQALNLNSIDPKLLMVSLNQ